MRFTASADTRSWLRLDSDGQAHVVEAANHDIMLVTGLPAPDLRILDPLLSLPSTVLPRERAIVINLEHVRVIITAQQLLLLNFRDPLVTPFLRKLQGAIQTAFKPPQEQQAAENANGLKLLPFEFVGLEVCLEAACSSLDNEARALEQETYLVMYKLSSKTSFSNLEPVEQIKSRLVAIKGRALKVKNELEHLLNNDEGMAEMHLTDKLKRDNHRTHINTHNTNTKRLDVEELKKILEAYLVQIEGTLNKLSNLYDYIKMTLKFVEGTVKQEIVGLTRFLRIAEGTLGCVFMYMLLR